MAELKAIRTRTDSLDKIEASTSSLAEQFTSLAERTTKLEDRVDTNSTKLQGVHEELASLKATVELQGRAIVKLTTMKAKSRGSG